MSGGTFHSASALDKEAIFHETSSSFYETRSSLTIPLSAGTVPLSTGFDFPVGDANGTGKYVGIDGKTYSGWYIAAGFLEESYKTATGSYHPAEDWNGVGGGNTDLGQPVYAISEGTVVRVCDGKEPGEEDEKYYGLEVQIQHSLPDGTIVYSSYWHLESILVPENSILTRGQQIGKIGNVHGNYLAHLHFEIHKEKNPCYYWPGGDAAALNIIQTEYFSPSAFINQHRKF